jgi:hypothetical protein
MHVRRGHALLDFDGWRWLIMMGHQSRGEALFYYFRLEDQVPENHLLRLIDKHISFGFVRERLKQSYKRQQRG